MLSSGSLHAVDIKLGTNVPPIQLHGFLTQGFLATTDYNYLSKNTKNGSFDYFQAGLNASFNPFPNTTISAQGFCWDVGQCGEYDVVLDYAQVQYTFNDIVGVRGGRIRRPEGLYNHIQDLDLARTWILLPQGMYNARWRDFYVSIDGGEFFGTVPLAKAGSLSYELFCGYLNPALNGGLAVQKANLPPYSPLTWMNSPMQGGGQFWWNTPISGLKAGAAVNYEPSFEFKAKSGRYSKGSPLVQRYSLEYAIKSWTFQAEYYTYTVDYKNTGGGLSPSTVHIEPDSWYFGLSYRFNKWVEAGGYYTEYYSNVNNRDGQGMAVPSDAYQKDACMTLRFDPTDWWILKLEGHYIRGTAQLADNTHNPVRKADGWWMFAVTTTFYF